MSDLEATSSRGQSAAPVTAIASGQLRAISGTTSLFAQSDGMMDAFAEVFASMAESSVQPIEAPDSTAAEVEPAASNETPTPSDQEESLPSEPVSVATESLSDVENLVPEVDQVATSVDVSAFDQASRDDESEDLAVDDESSVIENVTIVVVDVNQSGLRDNEIETPEVITAPQAQAEGTNSEHRARRESASVEPPENSGSGPWRRDHETDARQIHGEGDPINKSGEQPLAPSQNDGRGESLPRLRGRHRHDRESTDTSPKPTSQSGQSRAQRGVDSVNSVANGESVASPVGTTPAAPPRAATFSVESPIVNVQSIASSVNRSGTVSGPQGGTRGSTQAIDSLAPARDVAKDKPNPGARGSTTAETVSRVKLIQRVSKAFQHLGPDGGVVRLRLAPAEMGSVRVEMHIRQRTVQARVVAETEAASMALREHLPDLRARLESLGMQVEKLEIETETNDPHQSSNFDAASQQQQQSRGDRDSGFRSQRSESGRSESVSPRVPGTTLASPVVAATGGVDIRL